MFAIYFIFLVFAWKSIVRQEYLHFFAEKPHLLCFYGQFKKIYGKVKSEKVKVIAKCNCLIVRYNSALADAFRLKHIVDRNCCWNCDCIEQESHPDFFSLFRDIYLINYKILNGNWPQSNQQNETKFQINHSPTILYTAYTKCFEEHWNIVEYILR